MDSFGGRLKAERKRKGLTQEDFGALGGVQMNAQAKYEKEERHPDSLYLGALLREGVDLMFLFTGKRTPPDVAGLSEGESDLLEFFRQLSEGDQRVVRRVISAMLGSPADDGAGGGVAVGGDVTGQIATGDIKNQGKVSFGNKTKKE